MSEPGSFLESRVVEVILVKQAALCDACLATALNETVAAVTTAARSLATNSFTFERHVTACAGCERMTEVTDWRSRR